MGLFDIFKKKKEEKPEVVDSNGQVQVQPEGVQVVNNTTPQVAVPASTGVVEEVTPTVPIKAPVAEPVPTIPNSMAVVI